MKFELRPSRFQLERLQRLEGGGRKVNGEHMKQLRDNRMLAWEVRK